MQCQIHIQKGQLFFKSACQVHHSPECGFENGWRERRREKPETDRGGRSRRPVDIPAHLSDSHLPQRVIVPTALCLLHGRLAAPPPPCPKLYRRTLSALSIRNTSEPAGQLKGQISERLWGWAMALLVDSSPTTAAYYCLIRRRFKRRRKKRCERKGIPLHCTCCSALLSVCLSVCMAVCLSVCLSVRRREWLQNCAAIGAIVLVLFDCHHRRSDESLRAPLWNWSVSFRVACVVHVVMTLFALH